MNITPVSTPRVFVSGALELPDPAPTLSAEKAFALYFKAYPHFKRAILAEPRHEKTRTLYAIELPPVKTNG